MKSLPLPFVVTLALAGCGGEVDAFDRPRVSTCGSKAAIATSLGTDPRALIVVDPFVYFVSGRDGDDQAGSLSRVPLAGGAVESLASAKGPGGIAATQAHVYWTNKGAGEVLRIALADSRVDVVAAKRVQPGPIVADSDGSVYWVDRGTAAVNGAVVRAFPDGKVTELARANIRPVHLAIDATDVYFSNIDGDQIMRVPKVGGTPAVVVSGPGSQTSLAVDEARVYWTSEGEVTSALKTTGVTTVHAKGQANPTSVALRGDEVLWVNFGRGETGAGVDVTGGVFRVSKTGGDVRAIATGQNRPRAVTASGCAVVWAAADSVWRDAL